MTTHDIPLSEATVHGYFSRDLPPVLTIDAGDAVRFQSLNAGWRWEPVAELFDRDPALHGGHALNGPIEVTVASGATAYQYSRPGSPVGRRGPIAPSARHSGCSAQFSRAAPSSGSGTSSARSSRASTRRSTSVLPWGSPP